MFSIFFSKVAPILGIPSPCQNFIHSTKAKGLVDINSNFCAWPICTGFVTFFYLGVMDKYQVRVCISTLCEKCYTETNYLLHKKIKLKNIEIIKSKFI